MPFINRRSLLASASALILLPRTVRGETWPTRPVRLVVPFPAGGTTDILARVLADRLSQELGQPLIVDNRAGASGTIGAVSVANSAGDGYTLLFGGIADQVIAPLTIPRLPYSPATSFAPVSLLSQGPSMLVTHPAVPAKTIGELIDLARKQPGKLSFASAGIGNTSHLLAELLKREAGIDILVVPYKGNGPASNDLVAGHVQAMFTSPISALPSIAAGSLRAIAVTTERRLSSLPEVPTFAEAGLPGIVVYSWSCLVAPAGTPVDIIAKLNAAVESALHQPELQRKMAELDATVVGGPPEKLAAFLAKERERWSKVIEGTNIKSAD